MRCPYCGHDNSGNARRCENCGKSLERAKEKRREQRILIYAILLIILIAVGGVAAMFAVSDVLNSGTAEIDQPQKVTIVSTPTPTPTEAPAADSSASSEEAAYTINLFRESLKNDSFSDNTKTARNAVIRNAKIRNDFEVIFFVIKHPHKITQTTINQYNH